MSPPNDAQSSPKSEATKVENLTKNALEHNSKGANDALTNELNSIAKQNPAYLKQVNEQLAADRSADQHLPKIELTDTTNVNGSDLPTTSHVQIKASESLSDGEPTTLSGHSSYTTFGSDQGSWTTKASVDVKNSSSGSHVEATPAATPRSSDKQNESHAVSNPSGDRTF